MKTKPNNSDWQERFKYFCNKEQTEILVHPKEVKDFISSELQREREKTLKEVEWIIEKILKHGCESCMGDLHEGCKCDFERIEKIREFLSKIKELK